LFYSIWFLAKIHLSEKFSFYFLNPCVSAPRINTSQLSERWSLYFLSLSVSVYLSVFLAVCPVGPVRQLWQRERECYGTENSFYLNERIINKTDKKILLFKQIYISAINMKNFCNLMYFNEI